MSSAAELELEAIPLAEPVETPYEVAAGLLEKAAHAASQDPNLAYLVALAHKRDGRLAEARAALRKIQRPDANIFLQMGLLSLRENKLDQAEQEFAQALKQDPRCFAACHNLLLTRLSLGQIESAHDLAPAAVELAPMGEKHFLGILQELLGHYQKEAPNEPRALIVLGFDSDIEAMGAADERRLIELLRGLGNGEPVYWLLRTLANARADSAAIGEAYYEAALVKAKDLVSRGAWTEAMWLLGPLARESLGTRPQRAALNNLLGCCCYLTHDAEKAVEHFSLAVRLSPNDPRLCQNLALAHEMEGDLDEAEAHWQRFFELIDNVSLPVPPEIPSYVASLEFETLSRLANRFTEKEMWQSVIYYLQRAHRMRPDEPDVLERLFHSFNHARQPNNARKALDKLRTLRPGDPQLDLFEIDMIEVKNLSDIERMLGDIDKVVRRHPDDARVRDRAVGMVGNVIPLMGNLCDQLGQQLNRVLGQVEHLPRYQVDWSALHEIMRDLVREFQKLRRITAKCLPLVTNEEHKHVVRDLADHIDEKIELCRSIGG